MNLGIMSGVTTILATVALQLLIDVAYVVVPLAVRSAYRYVIMHWKCTQLLWEDINLDRDLHRCVVFSCCYQSFPCKCRSLCSRCRGIHGPASKCWQTTLGKVFSESWESSSRKLGTVRKPKDLPLNRSYVCTDARTILAFIMCTVDGTLWWTSGGIRAGAPWNPADLHFNSTHVQIKELEDGTVVAHLQGSLISKNYLTKGDIEGLLAGYPPWYREHVRLHNGESVPHSIVTLDDINRAGWIVAIGLSVTRPLAGVPYDGDLKYEPIRRTHDIINMRLRPAFPNDINVLSAADAVGYLASELTDTGVDKFLRGDFERYWCEEIPFLSESEAAFAMKVFNENPSTPLTPADAAKVKPILLPIVDAAFRGAFEVVSLLKNQKGKSFNWPSILQNPKQRIYVEDCLHLR